MILEWGQRRGERLSRTSCPCLVVDLNSDSAAQSIGMGRLSPCSAIRGSHMCDFPMAPEHLSLTSPPLNESLFPLVNLEIKFCNEATSLSLGVLGISGKTAGGTPRIGWTQMHVSHGVNWCSVNTKDLHHQEAPRRPRQVLRRPLAVLT